MDADVLREIHDKYILHWNYRDLCELPTELQEGQHVVEIYLKCNYIERLVGSDISIEIFCGISLQCHTHCLIYISYIFQPRWLGQLKNLTNLYLYGNKLQSLPDEIHELESLYCLDVGQNHLSSLPSTIGKLSQLNILCATRNSLTCLPEEICNLTLLKVLLLSGNMLSHLPESVCKCRELQELRLDENYLSSLPQQIVYLPKLNFLSVTGNQILYLPALPFISSPRLCFERNPFLNYLSHCLGSQISLIDGYEGNMWNLETFGCFEFNVANKVLRNLILHIARPFYHGRNCVQLVMPHGLRTVCCTLPQSKKVPSMYELSIRLVYRILLNHKLNIACHNGHYTITMVYGQRNRKVSESLLFPENIEIQLCKGPIALCNNPTCNTPIFTYAFVWIIPKFTVNRAGDMTEILSTLFFCSDYCSSQCTAYDELKLSQIHWQEIM